ncbi:MAG: hypothetical protein HW421_140 [Ignavibacteria bacterium]|nr:hypothetical protein [Ignavibacteria bacterium]
MNRKQSISPCLYQFVVILCTYILNIIFSGTSFAGQGDTIIVQAVKFTDTLKCCTLFYPYAPASGSFHSTSNCYYLGGTYLFPSDTIKFEKIFMNFTLKCNPANNPACGEWDFIGWIYAYKGTDTFELGRFETPYGFGLNLGNGFTWTYDVSDFRAFLYDSVSIKYTVPSTGKVLYELADIKFLMIEGTPPRDVLKIERLDYGSFRYGDITDPIDDHLQPITVKLLPNVKSTKMRSTVGGEGWGGSTGCAEFCPKQHWLDVNGVTRFTWLQWKDDCAMNPLYPQGGTWLLNRSNRCPGAPFDTREFELTPFVTGSSVTLQYHVTQYVYPEDGEFWPSYTMETQLVSYGTPNFKLDAALDNIISPNTWEFYNRSNPICSNPVIIIKNTGSTDLTNLTIKYGAVSSPSFTYSWSGNLKFLQKDTIELPGLIDLGNKDSDMFFAEVTKPNGGNDEYSNNNNGQSIIRNTPYYFNDIILSFRTNNYPDNNYNYTVKNANGNVIYTKSGFEPNTQYKDTFHLLDGCYEFRFVNEIEYGIDYWPLWTNYGKGWIKFSSYYSDIKTFNPDFGREIYHQFRVGPKPMLVATKDTLNFGDVNIGLQKELNFDITPGNKQPLIISNVNIILGANSGLTFTTNPSIDALPVILSEGQKMTVTVTFKPTKAGAVVKSLAINSNDARYSTKAIRLLGKGIDPNSVDERIEDALSLSLSIGTNPIIENTEVTFSAGLGNAPVNAKLSLFNSLGQELEIIYEGITGPFYNKILYEPANIGSGIYFLVLKSQNKVVTVPIIILKP